MDWKDHIIAEQSCQVSAQAFVPYASESFLVTLANKGLYKRALKDLETVERIELSVTGDGLQVTLDDATVTLNPNVAKSTCSCPSKTVCKHILMGILAASAYAVSDAATGDDDTTASDAALDAATASVASTSASTTGTPIPSSTSVTTSIEASSESVVIAENPSSESASFEPARKSVSEPWSELKKADPVLLRRQAGKKMFEDALRLIQDGWTAELTEGEMLEAVLNTENITVYFPRQNSLEGAVCKCGSTGLCKHKLIAVLTYLSRQKGEIASLKEEKTLSLLTEEAQALLESADNFIIHILDKGMIGCGETEVEAAVQYSIRMETCGIGNLARLFRSLSVDLGNMLSKHVGFSQLVTFSTLSRLHNTMRLILDNRQDNHVLSQLIESTRSDYYTTPIGHFTALGACPWQTRSGYFGITVYVFYQEKQSVCTYTVSMADYYEQTEHLADMENLLRQYQKNEHWGGSVSLYSLSHAAFTLRNFKLNSQNRLSSSSQTQCELTGKVDSGDIALLVSLPLFSGIDGESERKYDYFRKKQPPRLVLIPFTSLSEADFSHTEQKLFLTLDGPQIAETKVTLPYSEMTKEAIRYLERLFRLKKKAPCYMVCLAGQDGLMPVSVVSQSGINNFFFHNNEGD